MLQGGRSRGLVVIIDTFQTSPPPPSNFCLMSWPFYSECTLQLYSQDNNTATGSVVHKD